MTQRIQSGIPAFNNAPFTTSGVSLYVDTQKPLRYRKIKVLPVGRRARIWVKGTQGNFDIANSIVKTPRVGFAAASPVTYALPAAIVAHTITAVTTGGAGAGAFGVDGDITDRLVVGKTLVVSGSTANDGTYTIRSGSAYAANVTTINVDEAVSDATVDGTATLQDIVIYADVRYCELDVENESFDFRRLNLNIDGNRDEITSILGTASALNNEQRDAGIVRLRFRYKASRNGTQPDTFTAIRTAGPSSPLNAPITRTIEAGRVYLLEIDTPTLLDSSAYTYTIQASNGATTKDILTGLTVTADATGPVVPTSDSIEAW